MSFSDVNAVSDKATRAAKKFGSSKKAETLARWGLRARGGIYIVMGLLTLSVAKGSDEDVDQGGALIQVAHQPFGSALVGVLAIGFAGYSLWRFSEAAFGVTGDPGSTSARVISACRGVAYAILTFNAVSILLGSQASNADKQTGLAADLMSSTGGRWLVGIGGALFVGAGIYLVREGVTRRFMKYFPDSQLSRKTRTMIQRLGTIGNVARGLVFAGAGALVVAAAWTYDPEKAAGIDAAVEMLRDINLGWLLYLAAAGLVAFGVFGFLEARHRRV